MKKLILLPLFFCFLQTQSQAQNFNPDIDCPSVSGSVSGNTITITLYNIASSDNYNELFDVWDPRIHNAADTTWDFEGYVVYQLQQNNCLTPLPFENYMFDTTVVREVAQCDIANGISTLINHEQADSCNAKIMVAGTDAGIQHTFNFTTDAFTGLSLQVGNTYRYTAIAYAANPYFSDSACTPLTSPFLIGHHQMVFCAQLTGINEFASENNQLTVFPSPADKIISVDLKSFHGNVNLSVRDVSGQLVKEQMVSGGRNVDLDISELSRGIYFIETISNEKIFRTRFVKE